MPRPLPHLRSLLLLSALGIALIAPAGAGAAIGPLSGFGGFGEAAGQLRAPQGLDVTPDGEVLVADEDNNRVAVFSAGGAFLRAFGKDVGGAGVSVCTSACQAGEFGESAAGALYEPVDAELDGSGRVFVADSQNSRVDVFTTAGAFLFAFGKEVRLGGGGNRCDAGTGCQSGSFEAGAGAFGELDGIGIGNGRLYAADGANNRVDVYDLEGGFQFAFGRNVGGAGVHTCTSVCQAGSEEGKAAIDTPTDVAVGPDGSLYVAFNGNGSGVKVFSAAGIDVDEFGGEGPGFLDGPTALAIAPDGLVQVADEASEAVKTFSAAGAFVSGFAADGAAGLAIDCRGALFVSDYDGSADSSKVIRYGEPGTALPPCLPPAPAVVVTVLPSNQFKFGKLVRNQRKGTATLTVNVPAPGRLVLKGNGLVKATKTAGKAGKVKLTVKAKGKAKTKLNERGRATLKTKLTFTPTGGTALTKPRSLVLKKTLG